MRESEGMLDTTLHDLVHILATIEKNIEDQKHLHLVNMKLLKAANKLIDREVLNGCSRDTKKDSVLLP